jgi:capsular polysaccharide biosynthesis protein
LAWPPGGAILRTLTAGDVYRALWGHKFFIAALTAALVGATWYVTSREARTYEASTLVRVQARGPTAGDAAAALRASQTLAQTYETLISSGALNDEIAGRVGQRRVSAVTLTASAAQDLDLLSITARGRNATGATIVANATPRALRTFIRKTGSPSERIVIAKAATTPVSPVSRQLPLKLAIALMLGLIFNGALALLLELFRDRLPEPDELGPAVGQPVLATIPTLRLHPVGAVEVPREEPDSVLTLQQSLDGEGRSRATDQRVGPERVSGDA